MSTTEPLTEAAEKLMDVIGDLDAITDIIHGLGTAEIGGQFKIEGESVKFLATQLAAVACRISAIREGMEPA